MSRLIATSFLAATALWATPVAEAGGVSAPSFPLTINGTYCYDFAGAVVCDFVLLVLQPDHSVDAQVGILGTPFPGSGHWRYDGPTSTLTLRSINFEMEAVRTGTCFEGFTLWPNPAVGGLPLPTTWNGCF